MRHTDAQKQWEEYKARELAEVTPILNGLGYSLDETQPHIGGERYLMQAITTESGRKLILLGRRTKDGKRVVIKATSDTRGKRELARERICRRALLRIRFAYETFFAPEEILFTEINNVTLSIYAFLEQQQSFLERTTQEQFDLALSAFKAQESAHATTYNHRKFISGTLGERNASDYLQAFGEFKSGIIEMFPEKRELLAEAEQFLREHNETIEQYCGFLTHTDFVPHNFRIISDNIYLLDHSSIRFGNKYEGWARFINFMTLYNPKLAGWLLQYVKDNRTEEESASLNAMRVYRLVELMYYYTTTLPKTSGNLKELNGLRVGLWGNILEAVLQNKPVPTDVLKTYERRRDALRSEGEKKRQVGLH